MENKLFVNPDTLKNTANDFQAQAASIKTLHDEMLNTVRSLSSSWTGEAASSYLAKFAKLETGMNTINRMINEHVTDLNNIADTYNAAEVQAGAIADELPPSEI